MKLLNTIFNKGEGVCLGQTLWDTTAVPLEEAIQAEGPSLFVCINPLVGKRSDANCSAFRNILVEFDKIPLADQLPLVHAAGMPYTSCVFSGNKSYHFIVSVTEPFTTVAEYRRVAKWIYKVFPESDDSCVNPSRFSRAPGGIRPDTGLEQRLVELKGRVPTTDLMAWLQSSGVPEPVAPPRTGRTDRFRPLINLSAITRRTHSFLRYGAKPGHRTSELFVAACNLHRCGYGEAEIIAKAKAVLNFDEEPDWYRTVANAVNAVQRKT